MQKRHAGALVAILCLCSATQVAGQTAAPQPALGAEQAIQLFAEAGFRLRDGRPVNRCGGDSNPRVAFIDLDGDGRAQAHIADVDPRCYSKPGAFFAILRQQENGTWKRLIAEDGIVGFARARTQGWNNLTLDSANSACPGTRRFDGTDYGTSACGLAVTAALAPDVTRAAGGSEAASAADPAALNGTRPERLAQLLRNILGAAPSRSYETVMSAFPGATWRSRESFPARWRGINTSQGGTIALGKASYQIAIEGTPQRVMTITLFGPDDDNLPWEPIAAAVRTSGFQSRNIGCHSPTGFGYVRLTDGERTAVLHKFLNFGTLVPSTDVYVFDLDDPLDGRSEAEVAADRSLC